ncbi:MAG TPA: diguanylate cyclase [Holophaga sp.]|jgi:diguanylate cyclase (GGDEF)-like protein|nr:diguanylate cyclase [Holophaga sp.]
MTNERPAIFAAVGAPALAEALANTMDHRHPILFAQPGEDIAARIQQKSVQLIILDPEFPGLDLAALLRQLADTPATSNLPVLVIATSENEAGMFIEQGATDGLVKPFEKSVLRARLINYLNLSRCVETLRRSSLMDEQTGIPNRRRFDEFLNLEWRRNLRNQTQLSIVILNLDCFSEYTKRNGNAAADECLYRIASALAGQIQRPGDLFARYSRDGFACVLPETDTLGAVSVAEHLRAEINALAIRNEGSDVAPFITASLGIATGMPLEGTEPENLLAIAERQLVAAKQAGRNRVAFGA